MIVDTVAESMELGWFCTDLCDHAAGIYQCERLNHGSQVSENLSNEGRSDG